MRTLSFIGAGYVGLCNAVGFSSLGFKVIVVDIDEKKVDMINSGEPTILERGLKDHLGRGLRRGVLEATADLRRAVEDSDASFVCVQTPSGEDGSIDLKCVERAVRDIGRCIRRKDQHLVVVKSTVVPSTTESVIIPSLEEYSGRAVGEDFGVCVNPEFFSEGSSLHDFFNQDRIVIGEYDKKSGDALGAVYSGFDKSIPRLRVDLRTAEMIKYASNAFIGVKVSFANEIGNICKRLGIDGRKVMEGVALDHRFSSYFMKPGMGFGGPCLEKDISALVSEARKSGYDPKILRDVIETNKEQTEILLNLVKRKIREMKLTKVGILGLSYKADVSDIRGSPSVEIISALKDEGVDIFAYDPRAEEAMRKLHPEISYEDSGQQVVDDSDIVLISTDWREFAELNYKDKIVVDGRGILAGGKSREYEGICW